MEPKSTCTILEKEKHRPKPQFLRGLHASISIYLLPRKLTWNLNMMVSNRNLLFQRSIFRFHVSFRGSIFKQTKIWMAWVKTHPEPEKKQTANNTFISISSDLQFFDFISALSGLHFPEPPLGKT